MRNKILFTQVVENIAKLGLKPIMLAHKDMSMDEYNEILQQEGGSKDTQRYEKYFERDLSMIAVFGL